LEKREKDLLEKRFEVKDLEFNVILHKKPSEIAGSSVFAQTYQCAIQMIDSGINLGRGQVIAFAKVKAFNYRGKKFTVRPIDSVKKEEINIADYISNLYSMMGQILEPLGISKGDSDKAYDTLTKWFKNTTN
jgi:hypothetical protein